MPPECVVCDADATPPGALLRFRSRPEDLAWRERAERERLVGHPPDTGWLCADHVEAGRALAAEATLGEAVSRLRHPSPPATAASLWAIIWASSSTSSGPIATPSASKTRLTMRSPWSR